MARGRRYGPEAPDQGRPRDRAADPDTDPEETARAICLRLLETRARSRAELADALARRGAPEDVATRVLDRFTEVGLVDDAAYARSLTESRVRGRGVARRAVAAELRRRGVGDADTAAALATVDPAAETAAAFALAERRARSLAGLPADVRMRRLLGYLGRRGYDADLAWRAARAAVSAGPDAAAVPATSDGSGEG